jgi:hypothetical protein
MTSQGQVLPSMEKTLMYGDHGATTYIELCTFSIMYRSTKTLMYDDQGATTYIELCTFSIVYR